jgi:nitronate monooxygenase
MHSYNPIFLQHTGIEVPLICGAMYPCSNPELVAAVSQAGGIGVVQPLSLVYVHGYDFRKGLEYIRTLTQKPIGMNVITEKSSQIYEDRMRAYVDIALEMGVRFFVTSLGNPRWVAEKAHAYKGYVYHDVTDKRWAQKALDSGVDGLIAVNNRAGGHAGGMSPEKLYETLASLGKPVLCAGGVGNAKQFAHMMSLGYAGVQMGTRFIATPECKAPAEYKQAIVNANPQDIVLTERITGVPVAVINTPYVQSVGLKAGPLARMLLKGRKTKHWMRMLYSLRSVWQLKRSITHKMSSKDYWQAGKSVEGITHIEPAANIVRACAQALASNIKNNGTEG